VRMLLRKLEGMPNNISGVFKKAEILTKSLLMC